MMLYLLKTLIYIEVLITAGLVLFRWALLPQHRGVVSTKIAAIVLTTPAVALLCGNVNLLFSYLAVIVAFNSRSRLELAGVFLFLLPSTPMLSIEMSVAGVYLFLFSTAAAMSLGALVATIVTKAQGPRRLQRYDAAICFLIGLFIFIDNRFTGGTIVLRALVTNTLLFAAPYLLVSRAARSLADVEQLLLRWTLGTTLMAVTACFQTWRHWPLYETYSQALHVPLRFGTTSTALRAGFLQTGGSMLDYSASGLLLAGVITMLPLLRRRFHTFGFWTVLAVLIGGLLATQSRGAWVAALIGWAIIALWRRKWQQIALIAAGGLSFQAIVTILPAGSRLAEALGTSGHAQETANYRRDLAAQGLAQVRSHPLLGQPSGQLVHNLSGLSQGQHIVDFVNSHLFVAMATGVPLFLLWCAIWLMALVDGWRTRRFGVLLTAAPTAIIVPVLIALTFTSMGDRNLTWLTIVLALSAPCLKFGRVERGMVGRLRLAAS